MFPDASATLRGDRVFGGAMVLRTGVCSLVVGLAEHETKKPPDSFRQRHVLDLRPLVHVRNERNGARRVLLKDVEDVFPAQRDAMRAAA